MSSPPDTPKQKKGIRQLLKESFRSRSRSPSQSLLQPDLGAPSVTPVFDEGAALMANPSRGAPPDDSATTATRQTNISYVGASERAGGVPRIPIIVEPVDPSAVQLASSPEITVRSGPTVTNTPSKHTRNDPPELSIDTLERSTTIDDVLVDTEPNPTPLFSEHTPRSRGTSEPQPVLPTTILGDQGQRSRNPAWNGLRGSLRFLRDSSSVFPQLSLAIESLLSCLDGLEVAVQNRQEFEDLATELTTLSESLRQHMSGSSSMLMSGSTASVAMAIERQAIMIRERLAGVSERGMRGASMDEEELVKHYRKVQSHFRQLQTNASMSTWSIVNEHLVNTRLEGLSPTKQATYDSSLSTQISRRGCTEGTRIGVLDGLDDWLYDSTSSSIYWMNGMAGTGKTTIASTFCERIERRKLLAASFFCTRSSAECRDVTRIVPTIAYQLARYSIPFQSALCNVLGQNPDIGSKNVLKQFEQLLKEPLQQIKDAIPDSLVVVIDALDECDDRNGVELVLDMLFRHAAHVPLKFLLTSRPEPEIYSKMASHAQSREVIHLHDIEKSLVRADIELYLKEELGFMSPPASQIEIEQLVERAGALFIYAATLVRYIRSGKRLADPHKRLRSVLGLTPESTKKYTQIDALYTAVLRSALNEDELEADETEDIRVVLRTVLFAQEPIDVETIAELAEIDDPQRVIHALHPLRSVLHQSEETGLVSTLHASFPDFMFSYERSGAYFYDVVEHSQLLARRSLLVMKDQLRFNICNLISSFLPDKEVEDMEERIKASISPTLAYVCRYWPNHLALAPQANALLTLLDDFLCHRLLFWMEVLSLRRELATGIDGLLKVQQWLAHAEPSSSELMYCVDDARSFVASFAVNPTSQSTPHIYISSLSLCPHSSTVYQHYGKKLEGLLELKGSLMDVREGAPLAVWNVGLGITAFALSPDGTRVAIGCRDATIHILSAYDGTAQVGPLQGHIDYVSSVAFSLDGGRVVSGSRGGIRVWNAHNGVLIAGPFTGYLNTIHSLSFSPDGHCVVSGGHDHTVRVWNANNGIPLFGPLDHGNIVYSVRISANGALMAAPSSDYNIQLWDPRNGTPVGSPLKGHAGLVECLAFTPCSTRLVSGSRDHTVRVWNIYDGSLVTSPFEAHTSSIDSIAISPDGSRVASSDFKTVQVWKINDGTLVAGPFYGTTPSSRSMAYSPDGTRIIFSSSTCIYVRNVRDSMFPPPPPPPQDAVMRIGSVTFCPDNVHFLSGDGECTIRIWDSSSGSFVTSPNKANFFPTHRTSPRFYRRVIGTNQRESSVD